MDIDKVKELEGKDLKNNLNLEKKSFHVKMNTIKSQKISKDLEKAVIDNTFVDFNNENFLTY